MTGEERVPEVVLLRAGEVVTGHEAAAGRRPGVAERDWCRGPGRLTQALGVTGAMSGLDLCAPGSPLVIGAGRAVPAAGLRTGARVGVSGPGGDGTAYPWRFWVDGDPTVSAFRPGVRRRVERGR
ncbi:DNA-3-methyladenine glycosylase [Humibacillus xanthopallidus]|uniref:DNA-3-methyladenine glycosylase n=1 Tax=Humibacillus xanthopallidus TaxID=412689 RepID=UPI00319E612A